MSKSKGGREIPGQVVVPQVERYPGSDVLGMEYTTARPLSYATGADPKIPIPGKKWPETYCNYAQVKGHKVATFNDCHECDDDEKGREY